MPSWTYSYISTEYTKASKIRIDIYLNLYMYECTFDRPSENNNSFSSSSHRSHVPLNTIEFIVRCVKSHEQCYHDSWVYWSKHAYMYTTQYTLQWHRVQHKTKNWYKQLYSFGIYGQFTHEPDVDLANITDFIENSVVDLSDTKILFMFAPDGVECIQMSMEWDCVDCWVLLFVAPRTHLWT